MKPHRESAAPVSLGLSLAEAEGLLLFMAEHKRIWTVVAKQCGVESPELLVVPEGIEPEKRISVIRAIRISIPNLGLAPAKAMAETLPAIIADGVTKEEAATLRDRLEEAGGIVRIK